MVDKKLKEEDINVETLDKKKEELRKLRFDNVLGQLSDTSKINKKKKEIARVFTKLNESKGI